MIFRLLSTGSITAYEYLDGKEIFTDQYKVKFKKDFLTVSDPLSRRKRKVCGGRQRCSKQRGDRLLCERSMVFWPNKLSCGCQDIGNLPCSLSSGRPWYGFYPLSIVLVALWEYSPLCSPYADHNVEPQQCLNRNSGRFFRKRLFQGEIYKTTNMKNQALAQIFPSNYTTKERTSSDSFWINLRKTCGQNVLNAIVQIPRNQKIRWNLLKGSSNTKKRTTNLTEKKSSAKNSNNKETKFAPKAWEEEDKTFDKNIESEYFPWSHSRFLLKMRYHWRYQPILYCKIPLRS